MRKTFPVLLLLIGLFSFTSFSQTKLIAHKSHSGKRSTFKVQKYEDNFGVDPRRFPSTATAIERYGQKKIVVYFHGSPADTMEMTEHPFFQNPNISIDSVRKLHPNVKFVGFDPPKKK